MWPGALLGIYLLNLSFLHRRLTPDVVPFTPVYIFTRALTARPQSPARGLMVIAASMHGFANFWKFKSPVTLTLDRTHTHTTILWPFCRDHVGEPVPEENFWTLLCKGRFTKALHPDQPVPTSTISPFFTDRTPFLPANQQCQSIEGLAHSH